MRYGELRENGKFVRYALEAKKIVAEYEKENAELLCKLREKFERETKSC